MSKNVQIILISIIAIVVYTVCVVSVTLGIYKNNQKENFNKLIKDISNRMENKTVVQEEEDTTDYKQFKENLKDTLNSVNK